MINCDETNVRKNNENVGVTKIQLSLPVYAEIFEKIFSKTLGKYCVQPLFFPKNVISSSVKYERFVIDFISMLGDNLFNIKPQEFENILREVYLKCTFKKNGICYFRKPEDITSLSYEIQSLEQSKEIVFNKQNESNEKIKNSDLLSDSQCFKYEDVLKNANDKVTRKTNALANFEKTIKMKPFEIFSESNEIRNENNLPLKIQKNYQYDNPFKINKLDYVKLKNGEILSKDHEKTQLIYGVQTQKKHNNTMRISRRKNDMSKSNYANKEKSDIYYTNDSIDYDWKNKGNMSELVDIKKLYNSNETTARCGNNKIVKNSISNQMQGNYGRFSIQRRKFEYTFNNNIIKRPVKENLEFKMIGIKYSPNLDKKRQKTLNRRVPSSIRQIQQDVEKKPEKNKIEQKVEIPLEENMQSIDDMFSPINYKIQD